MKTFIDRAGRAHSIDLTVGRLQKISGLVGGKALDVAAMFRVVFLDLETFWRVLAVAISEPITDEAADAFDADTLDRAREAFVAEYTRFFPASARAELAKAGAAAGASQTAS